jgi:hypothetical protein
LASSSSSSRSCTPRQSRVTPCTLCPSCLKPKNYYGSPESGWDTHFAEHAFLGCMLNW